MAKTTAIPEPLNTGYSFQWYDKEDLPNQHNLPYMIPTATFNKLTKGELQPLMRIRIYKSKQEAVDDLKQAMRG